MQDLVIDLKFAVRSFRRSPALVIVVTVTLALGIGATTAIFSVLDATLLRPLPYTEPDDLVALLENNPSRGWTLNPASPANLLDWRERTTSLDDVTAHNWTIGWAITDGDRPEWARGTQVLHNFFDVLGARPILGRGFLAEENWNAERVVVISHGLWRRAFGGNATIVDRTIRLDDRDYRVVGVAPEGFSYPEPGLDLWAPLKWDDEDRVQEWFRRAHFLWPVGRLNRGATVEQADAEIAAIAAQLQDEYPETNRGMGADVISLRSWVVGETRQSMLILGAAVASLLLIACANIASLLLARASTRGREIGVRAALGAGRLRIVRQLVTESVVLSLTGGVLGMAVAALTTRALVQTAAAALPRANEIALDGRVLAFALATTLFTGLLFGLIPALTVSFSDLRNSLVGAGRTQAGSAVGTRLRNGLVVGEIALAVLLVAGAGITLKSLMRLHAVDPGFDADHLLTAEIELPSARYPDADANLAFYEALATRLRASGAAESVAYADALPLEGATWTSDFFIDGRVLPDEIIVEFNRRIVDVGYLETLGTPLVRGRWFTEADTGDAPGVIVVNETLAERYLDPEEPIGERLRFGDDDDDPWYTVVGVVGATKLEGLDSPAWPEILMPSTQNPLGRANVLVRFRAGATRPDEGFRAALTEVDPLIPLIRLQTFREIVAATTMSERLLAGLLGGFAVLALVLAAVGIYGIMGYTVAQRSGEIGLRMALGARSGDVVRMVVVRAAILVVSGVVLGVAAYVALSRMLATLLFEVEPTDPATLLAVIAVLALAAFSACYVPALRAARIDPIMTLQRE